MKNEFIFVLLN